jgi:hypothetical protein
VPSALVVIVVPVILVLAPPVPVVVTVVAVEDRLRRMRFREHARGTARSPTHQKQRHGQDHASTHGPPQFVEIENRHRRPARTVASLACSRSRSPELVRIRAVEAVEPIAHRHPLQGLLGQRVDVASLPAPLIAQRHRESLLEEGTGSPNWPAMRWTTSCTWPEDVARGPLPPGLLIRREGCRGLRSDLGFL